MDSTNKGRIRIVNWLLIIVFAASLLLALYTTVKSYDIVEIIDLKFDRKATGMFTSAEYDSLTIRSIRDILTNRQVNAEVKQLIRQMSVKDSLENNPSMSRIVSVNGVPWEKVLDAEQRSELLRNRSYRNIDSNAYLLVLHFRGRDFHAEIEAVRSTWSTIGGELVDDAVLPLLYLIPLFFPQFRFRKFFLAMFLLQMLASFMSSYGYLVSRVQTMAMISEYLSSIIDMIFAVLLALMIRKKPVWLIWLVALIAAVNVLLQSPWIGVGLFLLLFILIIRQERGVNRKFYLEFLYLVLILAIPSLIVPEGFYLAIPSSIREVAYTQMQDLGILSVIYGKLYGFMQDTLFILCFYIVFMMFIYRTLRLPIKLMERIFKYLIWVLLSMFLFTNLLLVMLGIHKRIDWMAVMFVGIAVVSVLLIKLLINAFPLLKPVRFSIASKKLQFIQLSYNYTDRKEYCEFFIQYLKKISQKYRIAIYCPDFKVGELFENVSDKRMVEAITMYPIGTDHVNIDIEILNDTEYGRHLSDFDKLDMPHLLLPMIDNKNELKGICAIGRMPGVYWHDSLAKAIVDIFGIFNGYYLKLMYKDLMIINTENLIKEQEAREYNEKLAAITQEKNALLEAEKKRIMESIEYASLIQKSILPQSSELNTAFPENFIIWRPRDVVGGDFYWLYQIPETGELLFAVIDCTGHSVPGALMSVAVNSALDRVVKDKKVYEPAMILSALHQSIGSTLHQESAKAQQDGMDMGLLRLNLKTRELCFSGAMHPLILIDNNTKAMQIVPANRMSVGGLKWKQAITFEQHCINLTGSNTLYLFTDGITDQLYMNESKKLQRLGTKRWYELLHSISGENMFEQRERLNSFIDGILKHEEQRDDICIAGIRL